MTTFAVRIHDVAAPLIAGFRAGALCADALADYIEANATLLRNNISQAQAKARAAGGDDAPDALARACLSRHLADRDLILANHKRFAAASADVVERIRTTYGEGLPEVVLVPCLGLYSAGGWADQIDGVHHIFVALERLPSDFEMTLLLAHEIAHAISEYDQSKVLGGFYNEGHATYVSSVLYPQAQESAYFFGPDAAGIERYDAWIAAHREKIISDAGKPFVVLDDVHKRYFTTSFSDTPNIGYLIGFRFLTYLGRSKSLPQLRTMGARTAEVRSAFQAWIGRAAPRPA